MLKDRQLLLANGVVNIKAEDHFYVYVTNYGSRPTILHPGMTLDNAKPSPGIAHVMVSPAAFPDGKAAAEVVQTQTHPPKLDRSSGSGEEAEETDCSDDEQPIEDMEVILLTEAENDDEKTPDWRDLLMPSLDALNDENSRQDIISMLERHAEIWNGRLGELVATEHRVDVLQGTKPIRQPPYRAGHESRQLIQHQVNTMLEAGVIEPSQPNG